MASTMIRINTMFNAGREKLLFFFGILLFCTSCIGEQYLYSGTPDDVDNQLTFEASAGLTGTKAAIGNPLSSTADLQSLGHFTVSAYASTKLLLDNQTVKWGGDLWRLSVPFAAPHVSTHYYAYANWEQARHTSFVVYSGGIRVKDLTVLPDQLSSEGHKDLLLASHFDSLASRRVHLHFRHPLTKITFRAGNVAPNKIDVIITEIAICNVASKADLTFPNVDGSVLWSNLGTQTDSYKLQGLADSPEQISQGFVVPDVSASPTDFLSFPRIQVSPQPADNALMLIPQEFESWDPNGVADAPDQGKSYLRLRILIKRAGLRATDQNANHYVYAGAVDTVNDRFIPTYAYAPLASIPKKTGHWEAGKQINYILNFGDNFTPSGGGGYDSQGKPILVPIRFSFPVSAIVDDWMNAFVPLITITYPKSN